MSSAVVGCPTQPLLVVGAVVWLDADHLVVQRRAATAAHGAGMLEFPGGKVEPGERPQDALARELREEWGARAGAQLEVGPSAGVLTRGLGLDQQKDAPMVLILFHVRRSGVVDPASAMEPADWLAQIECEPGATAVLKRCGELPLAQFMTPDREFAAQLVGLAARLTDERSRAGGAGPESRAGSPPLDVGRAVGSEIAPALTDGVSAWLHGGLRAWLAHGPGPE